MGYSASPNARQPSDFAEIIFAILGVAAKLERRRILERTARGQVDAKEKGVKLGRKPALTPHQQKQAQAPRSGRDAAQRRERLQCQPEHDLSPDRVKQQTRNFGYMGSMIRLALGNLEVDWGKNINFIHHGVLFQPHDVCSVPYHYYDEDAERPIIEMKEGYSRPLGKIVKRIELLGYTLDHAEEAYAGLLELHGLDQSVLPFTTFFDSLMHVDVTDVSPHYEDNYDFGEFFAREMLRRFNIVVPRDEKLGFRRDFDVGRMMENFHPWLTLRLLAENPKNLNVPVVWGFADVVEGGWISREGAVAELPAASRYLVVTEGSSDAKILKHALRLLRPETADFFRFVDMEEGYPFSGTGNLHKFCQGLASIGVLNRVLIIYDNDAEGVARYFSTSRLAMPHNMRVMKLPGLPDFQSFETTGPNGRHIEDINARAAAIECYLDLAWRAPERPCVQWKNFNKELSTYHGELLGKEAYARRFLDLRHRESSYNFRNIEVVLDTVIAECIEMARRCEIDYFSTPQP